MKLIKILCVVLSFFSLNTEGMRQNTQLIPLKTTLHDLRDPRHMPFKVGFKFQENNNLCPWAAKRYDIQKKPLFELRFEKKKLWHVEIDGTDIEFVTEPFADYELRYLEMCMRSIQHAISVLTRIHHMTPGIDIKQWIKDFNLEIYESKSNINLVVLEDLVLFDQPIQPPKNWIPVFSPQVTIQHPLEYTIGLYCYLLASNQDATAPLFGNDLLIFESLPFAFMRNPRNQLWRVNLHLEECLDNKVLGLTFLNAFTMVGMSPRHSKDSKLLKDTFIGVADYGQFDAKMSLALMSRRPFSQMFADAGGERICNEALESFYQLARGMNGAVYNPFTGALEPRGTNLVYTDVFNTLMFFNPDFFHILEVHKSFYKCNYAEQYYDSHHRSIDLSSLLDEFNFAIRGTSDDRITRHFSGKTLSSTTRNEIMKFLLQQGIISTTMLRNLIGTPVELTPYFRPDYYFTVLNSVQIPSPRIPTVRVLTTPHISLQYPQIDWGYDLLSPPIFLSSNTDAMGRYKNISQKEIKEFGEAVIEIRAIKEVGNIFLNRIFDGNASHITQTNGLFLVNPSEIFDHSMLLFTFLQNFTSIQKDEIMGIIASLVARNK